MNNKSIFYIIPVLFIILITTGCTNRQSTAIMEKGIISGSVKIDENLITADYQLPEFTANKKITISPRKITTATVNPQELIIEFSKEIAPDRLKSEIQQSKGNVLEKIGPSTYKVTLTINKTDIIEKLKSHPFISCIEYDYPVFTQNIPDDPFYPQQWNFKMLGMEKVWDRTTGGGEVVVAVIDSGILPDHPDLKGNITAGYDFVDNDRDPTDTSPDFSHGTHVAGIIGAIGNNSTGIAGINWQVKIMPVRVIGPEGNGGYSNLIAGINWAAKNGAQIINLSLAGSFYSESLRNAIKEAVNNGITVIAAAGNNGDTPVLYPAKYPEVISVGAVGPETEVAPYSNFGPDLDLVAPGGNSNNNSSNYSTILSTSGYFKNQQQVFQYIQAEGTSMATPHVSGIAALLYSTGINDPQTIKTRLKETAIDLGIPGIDEKYGAGLVNIKGALNITDDEGQKSGDSNYNNIYKNSLSAVKILIASQDSDPVKINSPFIYPDDQGRFSVEVKEGKWRLIAWLDTDNSNDINPGDYYAKKENINIKAGQSITGIELTLGKLSGTE